MVSESAGRYMAITTHAPQATTTCSVGGLIDYFVTHESERTILSDIKVISDTVVSPHSPVAATINENIYATKTLQQVVSPKWPQGDPVHERVTWEEAQRILLEDIRWKSHPYRYQDEMQEYYIKNLGMQTAGMRMADVYSLWSATNTVQMISEHTRDIVEMKNTLALGKKPCTGMDTERKTIKKQHIEMRTLEL